MNELYELKEMLCKELKKYGNKGELTGGTLEVVDKLAHAAKNLDKIIETYEDEGYSSASYPENSYARRNYSRNGSYARRNSMGRYSRYSRDDGIAEDLRNLMQEAPSEIKRDIQRIVDKLDQM